MKSKIKEINKLLYRTNMKPLSAKLISSISNGAYQSLDNISEKVADDLIIVLESLDDQANRMRKKMLAIGYDMLYDQPRNADQEDMKPSSINYENVSTWCMSNYSKHRKPLHKLNPYELNDLVSQFELVRNNWIKSKPRHNRIYAVLVVLALLISSCHVQQYQSCAQIYQTKKNKYLAKQKAPFSRKKKEKKPKDPKYLFTIVETGPTAESLLKEWQKPYEFIIYNKD